MVSLKKIALGIIAGITAALGVFISLFIKTKKELKSEKKQVEELKNENQAINDLMNKSSELRSKTNEKIENIDTGNNYSDFYACVDELFKCSKNNDKSNACVSDFSRTDRRK